jgi:hypothetical protein
MPATAPVWTLGTGTAGGGRLEVLGLAFGVSGPVTAVPADLGGGLMVGPADRSGPVVTLGTSPLQEWSFLRPPTEPVESVQAGQRSITVEEAESMMTELLATAGYDPERFDVEGFTDDGGAYVSARPILGTALGPHDLGVSVDFSGDGVVNQAWGSLAVPERGEDVELLSVDGGVRRLEAMNAVDTDVALVDVELSTMTVWLSDTDAVVMPAFLFTSDDGAVFVVEAAVTGASATPVD